MPEYYAEKLSDVSLGTFRPFLSACEGLADALRSIDPKHKVQHALELRDSIEVFQATDYVRFLHKMMPVFLKVLGEGQPIFVSTIPEQVN